MSPLEQLIMKKMQEGKQMSPLEQKAKMSNLDSLKDEMHSMMKGHLDGGEDGAHLEIASDSPEGLKEGLDKAQDVLGDEDSDGDEASEDEMSHDMPEDEAKGPLSPDEIDQLQMLLSKLKASQA